MSESSTPQEVIVPVSRPKPGRRALRLAGLLTAILAVGFVVLFFLVSAGTLPLTPYISINDTVAYILMAFMAAGLVLGVVASVQSFRAGFKKRGVGSLVAAILVPVLMFFSAGTYIAAVSTVGVMRMTNQMTERNDKALSLLMKYGGASRADVESMLKDLYDYDQFPEVMLTAASDFAMPLWATQMEVAEDSGVYTFNVYEYNLAKDERGKVLTTIVFKNAEDGALAKKIVDQMPHYSESIRNQVKAVAEAALAASDLSRDYPTVEFIVTDKDVVLSVPNHAEAKQTFGYENVSKDTVVSLLERMGYDVKK